MTELVVFDYGQLDVETRIVVRQRTDEIKTLVRRSAQDIADIGNKLIDVKAMLGHGEFGPWLNEEFGWKTTTAMRFMQVAHYFKSTNLVDLKIGASALYLLAAPSTPEPARIEAIQRAETGEDITPSTAKAIVAQHKPTPPPATPTATPTATPKIDREKIDREISQLSQWLVSRGWGITYDVMPQSCFVRKSGSMTRFSFGNREDRVGQLDALRQAKAHEQLTPAPATVLDRSLSAMDQEVAAIVEPDPRRAATPASIAEPEPEPEAEKEDSDEYYTPPYIIEAARQVLGKIDLDPASCKAAQRVVLATVYLNKANDSLRPKTPWLGRVWLNPPFSNPAPFTNKLIDEYEAGRTKAAILLVNNGTETKWGQALLRRYPVCFVGAHDDRGSRISFWKNDPDEPRTGNRYAQMIFYMGPTPDTFAEVFSQFGVIKT